jgi:hypothetical protein
VPPQHRALPRHEIPRLCVPLPEQHRVVLAFDEVLALLLLRQIPPAQLPGHRLHLALAQLPQRKHQSRELVLLQPRQEVRLVLGFVPPPQQLPATAGLVEPHPRIVPRGELFKTHPLRPGRLQQKSELHLLVAPHAGIRRAPRQIFLAEVVQHHPLVFLRQRNHPVLDPDPVRRLLGRHQVPRLPRPETPRQPRVRNRHGPVPDAHRQPHHPPAVLLELPRRHAGIHPPAQPHRHRFRSCAHPPHPTLPPRAPPLPSAPPLDIGHWLLDIGN